SLLRLAPLPPSVRTVCLAGEALPPSLARALHDSGAVRVLDLYGPSEDTIYSTGAEIAPGGDVTIGRPLDGSRAVLVDADLRLVPLGCVGEIAISGAGIARGYRGRPERTAEAFVPAPFSAVPGERLYRTGDLGRYLHDGRLQYLGRRDLQLKIRGFRIEPQEVEAALERHPDVGRAVVVASGEAGGDRALVAYVVARAGAIAEEALRAHVAAHLPAALVPAVFVPLAELPTTPSGKIDRAALPRPGAARTEATAPPQTPAEEVLQAIWAEVLGVERIGRAESFFALGGHSLLATSVLARIRDSFGVPLGLRAIFEQPTIAGLAREIEAAQRQLGGREEPPLVARAR